MSDGDAAPLDEKRFVSTGYKQEYVDPETDEVFTSHGLVGYRAIGHVDGYEAVVQIENGGGSGTFTSVMLLETIRDDETETTTFRQHEVLSSGDRCMGGYSDARVEDGELYFTVNTTMADMFSLTGDRDREILKSEAARNLPFCAICCYAEAEFSTEEFRGVRFPETRMKPDESDNDAARCVENMVTLNVKHGHDYMGAEEFGTFIHELEHVCLGRMEGEE
ncbi:MAG: hypothetical protein LRY76_00575 [Alphaproteobacteria bacterium]|nr:hypothetical protein [Alphaproteobacteria bacterium]